MTLDDVRRFLTLKGISDQCPSCGEHGWYFNGFSGETNFQGLSYSGIPRLEGYADAMAGGYIRPMIVLTCTNCAFVRLYDHYMVNKWVIANPATLLNALAGNAYGQR